MSEDIIFTSSPSQPPTGPIAVKCAHKRIHLPHDHESPQHARGKITLYARYAKEQTSTMREMLRHLGENIWLA